MKLDKKQSKKLLDEMLNAKHDPRVAAAVKSGRKLLKQMNKRMEADRESADFVTELHTLIDKSDELFQQIKKTLKSLED